MAKLQIKPTRLDLELFVTASLPLTLTLNQVEDNVVGALIDLTGYSAQLLIYPHGNIAQPYDTLSSANERLTLGGAEGTVAFQFTQEQLAAYQFRNALWVLTVTDTEGNDTPLLGGDFLLFDRAA